MSDEFSDEYLNAEGVEHEVRIAEADGLFLFAATLREYAEIVEAVATDNPLDMNPDRYGDECPECWYCTGEARNVRQEASAKFPLAVWMVADFDHKPDCTYLRARKVRGYE